MFLALIFRTFCVLQAHLVFLEQGRYEETYGLAFYLSNPSYRLLGLIMSVGILLSFLKNQIIAVVSCVGITLLVVFYIMFLFIFGFLDFSKLETKNSKLETRNLPNYVYL